VKKKGRKETKTRMTTEMPCYRYNTQFRRSTNDKGKRKAGKEKHIVNQSTMCSYHLSSHCF
jgi:hypothetical protein